MSDEIQSKRKYTKNFTQDEMKKLSRNIHTICLACSIYPEDLSGFLSKTSFNTITGYYSSGINYNPDYVVRRSTVDKFIKFFNEHYSPSISLPELLSDAFDNKSYSKKNSFEILDWYTGLYYCYYLDSSDQLCFGVLNISLPKEKDTQCEAIMDCDRVTFETTILPKIRLETQENSNKALIDIHKELMSEETIKESRKNFCYFSGIIGIYTYSIMLTITPRNNSYVRSIVFHRYDVFKNSDKNSQCIGAVGTMLKSEHSTPCSTRKILLSRYRLDVDNIEVNEDIRKALTFETISNTVIESKEDNNDMVYRLIRNYM